MVIPMAADAMFETPSIGIPDLNQGFWRQPIAAMLSVMSPHFGLFIKHYSWG